MLKDFTIANILDYDPDHRRRELFQGKPIHWEVLSEIGDFICEIGKNIGSR